MKTASGFEFEVNKDALDDWELLEDLVDLENNNAKMVPVCRKLLGNDGMQRLKEHCRDENGKVPASKIEVELGEIFSLLRADNEAKN